jgi:hypothetical protein
MLTSRQLHTTGDARPDKDRMGPRLDFISFRIPPTAKGLFVFASPRLTCVISDFNFPLSAPI